MRDIVKVALRLLVIMVVAGLCLGATYAVTKDPIAEQQRVQAENARRAVLPDAVSFEEVQLNASDAITACYRGIDASGSPCG